MIARLTAASCLGLFACAFGRQAAQPVRLESIGLQADRAGALLTMSLSSPVSQHVFRLHDPERLVIDLPATRRQARLPQVAAGSPVLGLRSGSPVQNSLRLVVELRGRTPARLTPSVEAAHYRLQIAFGAQDALPAEQPAAVPPSMPSTAPVRTRVASSSDAQETERAVRAVRAVRALHAPSGERDIVVAVDAGHGGDDPGASGQGGTHEKDVTLAIARALAARIDREPGMHAVLTRAGDYFVPLTDRIVRARAARADMFVSIHADAVRDRDVSGASVYILSERGASSVAAKLLAEKENAADLKGGISLAEQRPDVRSVLLDLTQSAAIGQSVEAADRVLTALDGVGSVRKRQVQQAAFVVLKSPDIPSMLVETAYISNPSEERKLRTPFEQERLAQAIFTGVEAYFRKYPPEGSLYAGEPSAHEHLAGDAQVARGG
ncbi:MAG TPA: N-acetylmuramoyl-L-alanine amidase [Steroidobacteraceae bacterium]|jgi:N-acetylmuramoyl-L-alanine amidase|nr:N-acetylmuramoyl-L-alanine amidase [Steroidobacteraceae bacterium]